MVKILSAIISVLTCLFLISCSPEISHDVSDAQSSLPMSDADISETYLEIDAEDHFYESKKKMKEQFPEIGLLCDRGNEIPDSEMEIVIWKKADPSYKVTITDRSVLRMFYNFFEVNRVYTDNFALSKFETYVYEIHYKDEVVSITVEDLNVFSLDKYPGRFFVTKIPVNSLGRAFLETKDSFLDLSVIEKMYYSAIITDETSRIAFFSEYTIVNLVREFVKIDKGKISGPETDLEEIQRLAFYYYGKNIYMYIYDGYILIDDEGSRTWYSADNDDIFQMLLILAVP